MPEPNKSGQFTATASLAGPACHLVVLRCRLAVSFRLASIRGATIECPTLNSAQLDELTALLDTNGLDDGEPLWQFVDRHGLPGLAFLEFPPVRRLSFPPPPPLLVPMEPVPLGAGSPALDETLGLSRRPALDWLRRQVDLICLAPIVLGSFLASNTLPRALWGLAIALFFLSLAIYRRVCADRRYIVPGALYIATHRRGRKQYTPRDTILAVHYGDVTWDITVHQRGDPAGFTWIAGTTSYGVRSLLAAWQSPLTPVPVEHWTDDA